MTARSWDNDTGALRWGLDFTEPVLAASAPGHRQVFTADETGAV